MFWTRHCVLASPFDFSQLSGLLGTNKFCTISLFSSGVSQSWPVAFQVLAKLLVSAFSCACHILQSWSFLENVSLVLKEQLPLPLQIFIWPPHFLKACGICYNLNQISFAIIDQLKRLCPVDAIWQQAEFHWRSKFSFPHSWVDLYSNTVWVLQCSILGSTGSTSPFISTLELNFSLKVRLNEWQNPSCFQQKQNFFAWVEFYSVKSSHLSW